MQEIKEKTLVFSIEVCLFVKEVTVSQVIGKEQQSRCHIPAEIGKELQSSLS